MQKFKPGDIVEVAFPFEDNSDSKIRPALAIKDYGNSFIVAKITSKHKGRKWNIELPKNDFNGLAVDSVVQIDRTIELSKSKLCTIIPRGTINTLQLEIIKQKLQEFYQD